MTTEQREKIEHVLHTNKFGVIATVGPTAPESAVITIITSTHEFEIVFGSFKGFRKNDNIKQNPNVSFVIGWDENLKQTVQIESTAKLLSDSDALSYVEHLDPEKEYFKITPQWMRYSDFALKPREVWEIEL